MYQLGLSDDGKVISAFAFKGGKSIPIPEGFAVLTPNGVITGSILIGNATLQSGEGSKQVDNFDEFQMWISQGSRSAQKYQILTTEEAEDFEKEQGSAEPARFKPTFSKGEIGQRLPAAAGLSNLKFAINRGLKELKELKRLKKLSLKHVFLLRERVKLAISGIESDFEREQYLKAADDYLIKEIGVDYLYEGDANESLDTTVSTEDTTVSTEENKTGNQGKLDSTGSTGPSGTTAPLSRAEAVTARDVRAASTLKQNNQLKAFVQDAIKLKKEIASIKQKVKNIDDKEEREKLEKDLAVLEFKEIRNHIEKIAKFLNIDTDEFLTSILEFRPTGIGKPNFFVVENGIFQVNNDIAQNLKKSKTQFINHIKNKNNLILTDEQNESLSLFVDVLSLIVDQVKFSESTLNRREVALDFITDFNTYDSDSDRDTVYWFGLTSAFALGYQNGKLHPDAEKILKESLSEEDKKEYDSFPDDAQKQKTLFLAKHFKKNHKEIKFSLEQSAIIRLSVLDESVADSLEIVEDDVVNKEISASYAFLSENGVMEKAYKFGENVRGLKGKERDDFLNQAAEELVGYFGKFFEGLDEDKKTERIEGLKTDLKNYLEITTSDKTSHVGDYTEGYVNLVFASSLLSAGDSVEFLHTPFEHSKNISEIVIKKEKDVYRLIKSGINAGFADSVLARIDENGVLQSSTVIEQKAHQGEDFGIAHVSEMKGFAMISRYLRTVSKVSKYKFNITHQFTLLNGGKLFKILKNILGVHKDKKAATGMSLYPEKAEKKEMFIEVGG